MKIINSKKIVIFLIMLAAMSVLSSKASAGSRSYVYSYGTISSNSYQQHRPQQYRPQQHRPQYQRPQYQRPQYQQPQIVNIYNQSSRPNYNYRPNYSHRPHVIVEKRTSVKTKDLAKGAAVVLGIHCLLGGC